MHLRLELVRENKQKNVKQFQFWKKANRLKSYDGNLMIQKNQTIKISVMPRGYHLYVNTGTNFGKSTQIPVNRCARKHNEQHFYNQS